VRLDYSVTLRNLGPLGTELSVGRASSVIQLGLAILIGSGQDERLEFVAIAASKPKSNGGYLDRYIRSETTIYVHKKKGDRGTLIQGAGDDERTDAGRCM